MDKVPLNFFKEFYAIVDLETNTIYNTTVYITETIANSCIKKKKKKKHGRRRTIACGMWV